MAFDVFVSYSRADREWAIQVDALLKSGGRTTFFDEKSLRAGDDWEAKIEAGLKDSTHFVALWSESAKNSDWVQREISTFYALARPLENPGGRQIFVNLAGQNAAYGKLHQIVLPRLQDAYAADTDATPDVWHDVEVAITAGLNPASHALEVPLVVMTLTISQVQALSPDDRKAIAAAFDLPVKQLSARYGPTRNDWHPLAGAQSINELLAGVKREIETALGRRQVVWKEPDAAFWTDPRGVDQYVRDVFLRNELALLVIDPVALHDRQTLSRLNCFRDCFERAQSVIAVLPPVEVPILAGLKRRLRESAMLYLDEYFEPRIPARHELIAQCAWNAGDADDIRRHLLLAAGRCVATPAEPSVWTGMGGAR